MQLSPTGDRLLLRLCNHLPANSKLVLPEGATLQPYGEVLAVGPDVKTDITVGTKVIYNINAAFEVYQDSEKLFIAAEGNVIALLRPRLGKSVQPSLTLPEPLLEQNYD